MNDSRIAELDGIEEVVKGYSLNPLEETEVEVLHTAKRPTAGVNPANDESAFGEFSN